MEKDRNHRQQPEQEGKADTDQEVTIVSIHVISVVDAR
jgi:hypothetical protein